MLLSLICQVRCKVSRVQCKVSRVQRPLSEGQARRLFPEVDLFAVSTSRASASVILLGRSPQSLSKSLTPVFRFALAPSFPSIFLIMLPPHFARAKSPISVEPSTTQMPSPTPTSVPKNCWPPDLYDEWPFTPNVSTTVTSQRWFGRLRGAWHSGHSDEGGGIEGSRHRGCFPKHKAADLWNTYEVCHHRRMFVDHRWCDSSCGGLCCSISTHRADIR